MKTIVWIAAMMMMMSGCVKPVKPWEKERLADPAMQANGGNVLKMRFHHHVHFSKEGSKGGTGVAGGGCGCN